MGAWLTLLADGAVNATAGATIALAVFALLALGSLSDAKKMRHGQLLADLSRRWDDRDVIKSVGLGREFDVNRKIELIRLLWGDNSEREPDKRRWLELHGTWVRLSIYPNVIEMIGLFVERGIVKDVDVFTLWGPEIIGAWNEWREPIDELKRLTQNPEAWRRFDGVAATMRRVRDEQTPLQGVP